MARSVEIKIAGWAGLMAGMHSKRWILLFVLDGAEGID